MIPAFSNIPFVVGIGGNFTFHFDFDQALHSSPNHAT